MSALLAPLRSLRALATRTPTAAFSSSSVRRIDGPKDPEDELADVLMATADEQDAKFKVARDDKYFKDIPLHRPLKATDLTKRYREKDPNARLLPRRVAPRAAESERSDVFHLLDINPLVFTTQPNLLSHFVSEMGMVYPRTATLLTPKNQRAISRAIRRARMMGVIPTLSKPRRQKFSRAITIPS